MKNWLFSTSADGANASMGIYTIIEMANLYGLSRYKYIEYLLEDCPSMDMSDSDLDQNASKPVGPPITLRLQRKRTNTTTAIMSPGY